MMYFRAIVLAALLFPGFSVLAQNKVFVNRPGISLDKPGYIDKAVLVVEPQGAYAEQSLYLTYSDHGGFQYQTNVQIVHQFELPAGSVINDMWLWIGDSIMQAKILDTWTGRRIYDSIINVRRDPAYLFRNGNQYEIRVFPLTGGSFRKVKMNIVTPIRWLDNRAYLNMPLGMLLGSFSTTKPVDVMFRVRQNSWGDPKVVEYPTLSFVPNADTLGYQYSLARIANVSNLSTFRLTYTVNFLLGKYFQSNEYVRGLNYFQYSLSPKDIFNIQADSNSQKVLVGLDLSGNFSKKFTELIPNLITALKSGLRRNDYFNVVIAGAGKKRLLLDNWTLATPSAIENTLNLFAYSMFGDSVERGSRQKLSYADIDAPNAWGFTGMDNFATVRRFSYLVDAARTYSITDIIASYQHGWVSPPSNPELMEILDSLNHFFDRGGRFIAYFNLDCNSTEKVVKNYIPSLRAIERVTASTPLFRNASGNIGHLFPESFTHAGNNILTYTDTAVRVEVKDAQGRPVIISKRISNGLLVVSGLWLSTDNEATRRALATPILGINRSTAPTQIFELLNFSKAYMQSSPYDKLIFMSNSDSAIAKSVADNFVQNFIPGFGQKPIINCVNLLNETSFTMPSVGIDGNNYLGGGYLMKRIADSFSGQHIELVQTDWPSLTVYMNAYAPRPLSYLKVTASEFGDTTRIVDFFEVKQDPINSINPRSFIGSTRSTSGVTLSIQAKFHGNDTLRQKIYNDPVTWDAGQIFSYVKAAIVGNEKIKRLFQEYPVDTARVVALSVTHRVLTDYSCFLALEPNDTNHFIRPFDESRIVPVELLAFTAVSYPDSIVLAWRTATELNNSGFCIERLSGAAWQAIATITGHGTSTIARYYSYTDANGLPAAGTEVRYRLVQVDLNGNERVIGELSAMAGEVPADFGISQNYPNPFNPVTIINYRLPKASNVEIKVFDMLGNQLDVLVQAVQDAGYHSVAFDGSKYASGTYFYALRAGSYYKIMKMMLIK